MLAILSISHYPRKQYLRQPNLQLSYKISHPPGLQASWDTLPSFASSSQSAKIGLSKWIFYVKNHPNLSELRSRAFCWGIVCFSSTNGSLRILAWTFFQILLLHPVHVYQFWGFFPTYMSIPSYKLIYFEDFFPHTFLFQPTYILIFDWISHLTVYRYPKLRKKAFNWSEVHL